MKAKTTRPPEETLAKIRARDKACVYCGKEMISPWDPKNRKDSVTIEHLNHKNLDSVGSYIREGKPVSEIVAICCGECNSSRSDKSLLDWFETDYCKNKNKGINYSTVTDVVRKYIDKYEK